MIFSQSRHPGRPGGTPGPTTDRGEREPRAVLRPDAYSARRVLAPLSTACAFWGLVALTVVAVGCSGRGEKEKNGGEEGTAPLSVLVLGDPTLTRTVEQLHGQWQTETGGEIRISRGTEADFDPSKTPEADVLVFPSRLLGVLAEPGHLLELDRRQLVPYDEPWSDMFDLVRLREAAWGEGVYAVPLGSPVLVCYYRADLFEQLDLRPPETWEEYQRAAQALADGAKSGIEAPNPADWAGTIEPLAAGWRAQVLLARAASYAKTPDSYSTLFDIQTMEPCLAAPPFVRALEELVAAAETGSADRLLETDPAAARQAFWKGNCGMALTWPSAAADLPENVAEPVACAVAPLPGARTVFDRGAGQWRATDDLRRVPLLAVAGRLVAVSKESPCPEAALRLAFWLAGRQGAGPRQSASEATTLFRRSDAAGKSKVAAWVEPPMPDAAALDYAQAVQASLTSSQWLFALRIPGRQQYFQALDRAVAQAVLGERTAEEALKEAAQRWSQITEELGAEGQRRAYRRSLGLE